MKPRIQYVRTSDDVNIAVSTGGEGRSFVFVPVPALSHAELVWQSFPLLNLLSESFRVVIYDSRGSGLSDRDAIDFSMDAMIRDLEAVTDRTNTDPFVLAAVVDGVPIALTYAARYPERVSHLILVDGWTKFTDYASSPAYQVEARIRDQNWVLYSETFAQVLVRYEDPAMAREFAEFVRACVDQEAFLAAQAALETYDATSALPLIKAPTLVVHNRNNRWVPAKSGQRIASAIADSRLEFIDDLTLTALAEPVKLFLTEEDSKAFAELRSGMTAILFADIADSTALTESLGDGAFRTKARDLDAVLRTVIREHAGTPIEGKLLGDGVLAVFTSARQAIEAALACGAAGSDAGLLLHLGLHAGDVIREDNNVYGGAVNIASRISGLSAAGEVLVSETVRSLARTSAGVRFEDRGERELKGVGEKVRVWKIVSESGSE